MRNFAGIKPQDILVMLKLIIVPKVSQKTLSSSLYISQAEISHALQRLKFSKLMTSEGAVNIEAAFEFLVHGLKYIFPAEEGALTLGIPTAHSHPDFKHVRYTSDSKYVWPDPEGKVKGTALFPFYPSLPEAAKQDKDLYALASLVEMIRVGRAREQKLAAQDLKVRFEAFA